MRFKPLASERLAPQQIRMVCASLQWPKKKTQGIWASTFFEVDQAFIPNGQTRNLGNPRHLGPKIFSKHIRPSSSTTRLEMSETQVLPGAGPVTQADMNYAVVVPGKGVGRYIRRDDEGDLVDAHDSRTVSVRNARELSPAPTLDSWTWELLNRPTSVQDFYDDDEIRRVYYKEVEEIVLEVTGAARVIVFDHTRRDTSTGSGLNAKVGDTATAAARVHTDYSDRSGPARVRTLGSVGGYTGVKLSEQEVEASMSHGFCIVNLWRNIRNEPVEAWPLAVMDPKTLERDDFVEYKMRYPDREGENYGLRFNPAHQWYFYPRMEKDECLLIKTWESRKDRHRYCFHTAFDNKAATGLSRSSIEVRCVVIMPPAS